MWLFNALSEMDSTATGQELPCSMLVSSFHLEEGSSRCTCSSLGTALLQVQPGADAQPGRNPAVPWDRQTHRQSVPEPRSSDYSRWIGMRIRTEMTELQRVWQEFRWILRCQRCDSPFWWGDNHWHADRPVFSILDCGLCRDWQLGVSMSVGCTRP